MAAGRGLVDVVLDYGADCAGEGREAEAEGYARDAAEGYAEAAEGWVDYV